ncbi:MAG: thiamine phosphate synthase [Candidatus Omnitrophota bacterium]
MSSKKQLLQKSGVYLVIDNGLPVNKNLFRILSVSLDAGVDMVQLRDKTSGDRDFLRVGREIKEMVREKKDTLFIINDRIDMALNLDADGVHIGNSDAPMETARKVMGVNKIIGVSAGSLEEAMAAETNGADYIGLGPVFDTPIKPATRAVGIERLRETADKINTPLIAIGGINESNVEDVARAGIKRIAVIRAIMESNNPYLAVRNLLEKISNYHDSARARKTE